MTHPRQLLFLLLLLVISWTKAFSQITLAVKPFDPFDINDYEIPVDHIAFRQLAVKKPVSQLPASLIDDKHFHVVPSLDTVIMDKIYDRIRNPEAICFRRPDSRRTQSIAIRRKNDWLILDFDIFMLAAPSNMKMSWKDIGIGHPVLHLALANDDSGIMEGGIIENSEHAYFRYLKWTKEYGFCLIDPETISYLAEDVRTGYQFEAQLAEYHADERDPKTGNIVSYTTNSKQKYFDVKYDFKFVSGKNIIKVSLKQCEQTVTVNPGIYYIGQDRPADHVKKDRKIDSEKKCQPMFNEGTYVLTDGKFILKE